MTRKLTVACIQNCATDNVAHNIARCTELVGDAAARGATFIALPEYFSGLRTEGPRIIPAAWPESDHPVIPAFATLARNLGLDILLGSIGVISADGRIFNRSILLDGAGRIAARYDKLHMFDITMPDGKDVRESATIAPGDEAVLAPFGDSFIGLSICYDLRFAPLYRRLAKAGAEMLAVPAAFTRATGEAHWHVLNRARAIETGAFVIAPCQWGTLEGGAECFGHSLIVDPWGRVLADGGTGEGMVIAEIDLDLVGETRRRIPSLDHDRPFQIQGDENRAAAE